MITSLIPPTNVGIDCLFEGHIDALLDHKTQENFIQCFPGGGKCVLWSAEYSSHVPVNSYLCPKEVTYLHCSHLGCKYFESCTLRDGKDKDNCSLMIIYSLQYI